ncbi:MAG TPA: hypothetical protein VMF65_25760 [Acidimicrobiales bacterium]|jgi:hypothetical protein|nr:hypothetical protein [Acidimicrobiales bacterium]
MSDVDAGDEREKDSDDRRGRELLAELYGTDGPPDLEVLASPVRWPDLPAVDAAYEWRQLRAYVEELVVRFAHLDHTVIPSCWWRHSGHVEALQALRDHERVAYSDNSPGTAATDWHRAFTLIEGRLREWTGHSGCAAGHKEPLTRLRPVDDEDWEQMLLADAERRRQREIAKAANAG